MKSLSSILNVNKNDGLTILMCGNIEILKFNLDNMFYEILEESLLPFILKGVLKPVPPLLSKEQFVIIDKNRRIIERWLSSRTLLLSRENAKEMYNLLNIEQEDTVEVKVKIATLCRAVSVLDNYWLKFGNEDISWESVNVRHNSLNSILTQVALNGAHITLQGSLVSPELSTNGTFAKAWRRLSDGLWLYKKGKHSDKEARIEVICSKLLDKMNVEHCQYIGVTDGEYMSICPCLSDDNNSIITAQEFSIYCGNNGLNFDSEIYKIDCKSIYKMWIVDYLFANHDRHLGNWGFYYNPHTMEIKRCHPLFDHNMSFKLMCSTSREAPSQFGTFTMRGAAMYAIQRVNFYFTDNILPEDFLEESHYIEFVERAKELGLL